MLQAFEEVMAARGQGNPEPGEVHDHGASILSFATRFRIGETCDRRPRRGWRCAVRSLGDEDRPAGKKCRSTCVVRPPLCAQLSYLQRQLPDGAFAYVPDENQEAMRRIHPSLGPRRTAAVPAAFRAGGN